MTFDQFELAIIELAGRGVTLTVANVAAHLHVTPTKAEEWLDEMAKTGRLDLELDETVGLIYYRVRGLTPPPTDLALRPRVPVAPRLTKPKNATVAAVLGLLLPGAGLLYAAPVTAALVVGLITLAAVKMLSALPVVGALLSSVGLGICALGSAYLGTLYARQYNRHGRRTHLEPATRRALLAQAASTVTWRP
ncbi:MAG: hypothetical protein KC731_32725 [Myxococcales bacterium]|nr:hypothetical protein [Myxococcales bacterium]